jgi:hypothetical protein
MGVKTEIIFEQWRLIERRCYFLLSSAGAGIGYAIATIEPDISPLSMIVFWLSLLSWSASFSGGLFAIKALENVLSFSVGALSFREDVVPLGTNPGAVSNVLAKDSKVTTEKLRKALIFQIGFLLLGAVLFALAKLDVLTGIINS